MPRGDHVDALRRRDHQQLDGPQVRVAARLGRDQRQRLVDALQALHVHRQRVEEDARHRMPRDLRQRGVAGQRVGPVRGLRLVQPARAHHQHAPRAQVDRRRDGRRLAHRPVAEILGVARMRDGRGREDEGNGRGREQVRMRDRPRHRLPLRAHPGLHRHGRLVEGEVFARAVARGRDGQRAQVAVLHQARQAVERHQLLQQVRQRRVVEQRARLLAPPARQQPRQPVEHAPAARHVEQVQPVGAVHLLGPELLPHVGDVAHRVVEVRRAASQRRRVDGAGRGAGDDGEGVAGLLPPGLAPQVGQRLQHAHLVGGAGTAAGEQQPRGRSGIGRVGGACGGGRMRHGGSP